MCRALVRFIFFCASWSASWGVLFAPGVVVAQDTAFEVVNRSTVIIDRIYLAPLNARTWGRDWLGDGVLNPGYKIKLDPGSANGCVYHVRVAYRDNRVEDKRQQDLCKVSELTFNASAAVARQDNTQQQQGQPQKPPARNPDFKVVNRSTKVITGLFVSAVNDENWGNDRLPGTIAPGEEFMVRLPRDGRCNFDIRVVYDDKTSEERRAQDLCSVEQLAFSGQPGQTARRGNEQTPPPKPPAQGGESFGTGFFVTEVGHALTNHHVIEGCRAVGLVMDGRFVPASVVRSDERNDLSLLRVQLNQPVPFARFRGGSSLARPGDGVVVAGFPLPTVLQNGLNVTVGNVSSLAGLGGNTALVQITAPVQPGNSGGPLFDMHGTIIGVVVSKLNAQRIAQSTGDIPQNINFAVHGSVARLFVESSGQRTRDKAPDTELKAGQIGEIAQQFTVQVACRK